MVFFWLICVVISFYWITNRVRREMNVDFAILLIMLAGSLGGPITLFFMACTSSIWEKIGDSRLWDIVIFKKFEDKK